MHQPLLVRQGSPREDHALEGRRFQDNRAALDDGPKSFEQLMAALGSRDGRDVVIQLDELRQRGLIERLDGGAYGLKNT